MRKIFFILTFILSILSFNAFADDLPSCGTNCTYSYIQNGTDKNGNKTYTLTIAPIDDTKNASISSYLRCLECSGDETGNFAPWRFEKVTSVVIEKGVTGIGGHAFEDMSSLQTLELPEGLKTIGYEAFHDTSIKKVDLPSTLTSIGSYAFAISALKEINELPEGLKVINSQAFSNTQIKDFIIPASVTSIAQDAFGCTSSGWKTSLIENLYCAQEIADQCEAAIQWKKDLGKTVKVTTYKKNADGTILYNNHWYQNPNDILAPNGHIQKRIYTIDEANAVTGDKNRVSIKYR